MMAMARSREGFINLLFMDFSFLKRRGEGNYWFIHRAGGKYASRAKGMDHRD